MVVMIVFVLTIANAFAMYAVGGGHPRKLIFYLAITTAISGVVLLVVPSVASTMFKIV